jgi:hypothetical protein
MALGKPHRLKNGEFDGILAFSPKFDDSRTDSEAGERSSHNACVRCVY